MSLDLSRPLVYLITSGDCEAANCVEAGQKIVEIVVAAVECGVDLIQIREKRLSGKLLLDLTERVVEVTLGSRTKLLVNDRFDIALAAGADGVHLTTRSVPVAAVRSNVLEDLMIGASCHSGAEIAALAGTRATFALYGSVFASPGKGTGEGIEDLRDVCRRANRFPVLAVGGVDEMNYEEVLNAGAAGFAAIRALNDVDSMRRIMKKLGR